MAVSQRSMSVRALKNADEGNQLVVPAASDRITEERRQSDLYLILQGDFTVVPGSVADPQVRSALQVSHRALRRIAGYVLPPALEQRMRELGERKEFLSPEEHDVLMALVAFAQQRSVDKLEADLALQRLEAVEPGLATTPYR
jgi:hypothetical protein